MGLKTHKKPTAKVVPPSPDPSSDDDDDEDSSDDEHPSPTPPLHPISSSNKPFSITITKLPISSDDDEDEDDVEHTQTPPPPPQPKPTPTKRPADSEPKSAVSEKKHKQDKPKPPSSPPNSKGLFEKIWSPEDEAVILNRILEFKSAKGFFATANHGEVLESIRDRLSVTDPKKEQLTNKVRGLRDRYFRFKSGKKSSTCPNDELLLKVGDIVWANYPNNTQSNGIVNGNSSKTSRKTKDKVNGVVGEAREEIVEEEKEKGVDGSDSDGGFEFDLEYLESTDKIIKAAMKKMSEEDRNEVNEKLMKADAKFKEAYCLKLEVLLMVFKKNAGLA